MEPKVSLCTVFDHNYLPQALTMIESLETKTALAIDWHILALTDQCYEFLSNLRKSKKWKVFRIEDLEDAEFKELANSRPWREYCWTAASVFLFRTTLNSMTEFTGYVDADCYFFNDIEVFLDEMQDSSVLIFEHNFSPDRISWRKKSGIYNVGLIIGRNNQNFLRCLQRWRGQVINECVNIPELGKCGDQTYLNEWPDIYPFVKVSRRLGASLAPWNLNNFSCVSLRDNLVDNHPIDFFHFHGLYLLYQFHLFVLYIPAGGYSIRTKNYLAIYRSYVRHLMQTHQDTRNPKDLVQSRSRSKNVFHNWRQIDLVCRC